VSRPQYPSKKDENHDAIANAFRKLHWQWVDTYQLGYGFPDGVVSKRGVVILVEVKNGPGAELTSAEREFQQVFEGDYRIIRTEAEVEAIEREFFG
jgi:hypothetical protein